MTFQLVVVQPFGAYPVGALVSDAVQVEAILASEQAACVVRIAAEQAPAGGMR